MAKRRTSFKLKNTASELDTLCQNLTQFGDSLGLTKKCVFQINLALDELFTNIVTYAYPDDADHWIKFALSLENGTIVIRVEDSGIPFDPASVNKPDQANTVEDCPVGGLGIHLIRKLVDDVEYRRKGKKNILTLKKIIQCT
jgi:serine/threonine-protein kinase RsbW